MNAIRQGNTCQASVYFSRFYDIRPARQEDGGMVSAIYAAAIEHISIVPFGAYAATSVWLADTPLDQLPPETRLNARRWAVGNRSSRLSTGLAGPPIAHRRAAGKARPSAALLARLDGIIASGNASRPPGGGSFLTA